MDAHEALRLAWHYVVSPESYSEEERRFVREAIAAALPNEDWINRIGQGTGASPCQELAHPKEP